MGKHVIPSVESTHSGRQVSLLLSWSRSSCFRSLRVGDGRAPDREGCDERPTCASFVGVRYLRRQHVAQVIQPHP